MAEFLHKLLSDELFRQDNISVVMPDESSFVNWRNEWAVSRGWRGWPGWPDGYGGEVTLRDMRHAK
ncbi:hypothetical protein [Streptomyces sp. NPDC001828]|uniref:hypothetical protein n=1 Tax=Streptomyces sp. NPDC001828 TaxID=3364615 RepID=UPI0036A9FA0D